MRALYHRSGWTQDELAKVEECSQAKVRQALVFGRFLDYSASGGTHQKPPVNLKEGRFRGYWEATEKNPNERAWAAG